MMVGAFVVAKPFCVPHHVLCEMITSILKSDFVVLYPNRVSSVCMQHVCCMKVYARNGPRNISVSVSLDRPPDFFAFVDGRILQLREIRGRIS